LTALGITLLATAIRLPGLASKPFWIAEVQEFAYAHRPGFFANPEFSAGDFVGYFYHSLCHLVGLPPIPVVVRAPALLLGSLLPALLYYLMQRRGYGRAGLLAALFLALSLPALQLSQEGRLYAALSTSLALGLLTQWLGAPGSRRTWLLLGLWDGLALASHPYAAFWILVRWVAAGAAGPKWRRSFSFPRIGRYLPVPTFALGLQLFLVAAAAARFRTIHTHFSLQPYPPDFPFAAELFGHLGAGAGLPAALFGFLAVAGAYALSLKDRAGAILLTSVGFLAPLLTLSAIWLARSRFGFVHLFPAAIPLYLLAAFAFVHGWQAAREGRLYRLLLGVLLLSALLRMGWLDCRYHQRTTRLEMGADVAAACSALATKATAGDIVITSYDKYFTLFAWYCGPVLAPDVTIAADNVPASQFVRAFNHLAADGSPGPLPLDRVQDLAELTSLQEGATVFLMVPYFEDIEGRYSESLGWYDLTSAYGRAVGPTDAELVGWEAEEFPLLKLLHLKVEAGMRVGELRQAVQHIQAAKRSWF